MRASTSTPAARQLDRRRGSVFGARRRHGVRHPWSANEEVLDVHLAQGSDRRCAGRWRVDGSRWRRARTCSPTCARARSPDLDRQPAAPQLWRDTAAPKDRRPTKRRRPADRRTESRPEAPGRGACGRTEHPEPAREAACAERRCHRRRGGHQLCARGTGWPGRAWPRRLPGRPRRGRARGWTAPSPRAPVGDLTRSPMRPACPARRGRARRAAGRAQPVSQVAAGARGRLLPGRAQRGRSGPRPWTGARLVRPLSRREPQRRASCARCWGARWCWSQKLRGPRRPRGPSPTEYLERFADGPYAASARALISKP